MLISFLRSVNVRILKFKDTNFIWLLPKKADVLIYDSYNSHIFADFLKGHSTSLLHVRGEELNIAVLFLAFINCFWTRERNLAKSYKDCFIKIVRPRVILTFIDNSYSFFEFSKKHKNIRTIFVQNGWRSYYGDIFETLDNLSDKKKLKVDFMLVFGESIGNEYLKFIKGNVIPIGSLKNNAIHVSNQKNPKIVSFISQWHASDVMINGKTISQKKFFKETDLHILNFLRDFCKQHGLILKIIPRNFVLGDSRNQEIDYYRELLNEEPLFSQNIGATPSYDAVDESEIVICIDSTLGYEAAARGTKTAFFSIRGTVLDMKGFSFGWPQEFADEGPFWTNRIDTECFSRVLKNLVKCPTSDWHSMLNQVNFASLMKLDVDNQKLRELLDREISRKLD